MQPYNRHVHMHFLRIHAYTWLQVNAAECSDTAIHLPSSHFNVAQPQKVPLSPARQSAIFNPLKMIIAFPLNPFHHHLPSTPLLHLSHLTLFRFSPARSKRVLTSVTTAFIPRMTLNWNKLENPKANVGLMHTKHL